MKSIQYSIDGTPVESPAHADVVTDETVKVDIVDTYEKKQQRLKRQQQRLLR